MTQLSPSTYRLMSPDESAQYTCSTIGCQEPPWWVHTVNWPGGIGFYTECKTCKARIETGAR